MASALIPNDVLGEHFEKWLLSRLKVYNEDVDESLVNYIISIISDEDSGDEEKIESIEPLLQELNQVSDKEVVE